MEKQKKVYRFLTLILAMVVSVLCLGIMGAALRANTYQAYAKQAVGAAANVADGVYNGSAQGFNGPVTVAVTVKDKKITAIKILSISDTPSFFDRAKNGIIPAILKTQSTDVDVVSGATYSSNGIKNAGGALDSVRWRIFTPVCIPMARQKNAVSRLRGDELWFSLLHAGILALLLVRPGA